VTGSHSRLRRPALWMAPDEPDQVLRLMQFRKEHPDVVIGTDEFGTWQARIPEPDGETVVNRYRLCELLDRLDELTGQHDGQPGRRSRLARRRASGSLPLRPCCRVSVPGACGEKGRLPLGG